MMYIILGDLRRTSTSLLLLLPWLSLEDPETLTPLTAAVGSSRLRVLFIGLVLLSGICLGSVHGTTAGDCRTRYLGSLYLLIISTLVPSQLMTMRYSVVLSLNLIAKK